MRGRGSVRIQKLNRTRRDLTKEEMKSADLNENYSMESVCSNKTIRMIKSKHILLTLLTASMLTSCEFISNTFQYKDTASQFIESLLEEDYDKCVDYMAMEHEMAKGTDIETMKTGFKNFRESIVSDFGTELTYSFMKSEKTFSSEESKNTPPNTTVVFVEFSNNKEFGVFKVLFDDTSKKILNINKLDVKRPIPPMTIYWLYGLLALCVPVFNIYVIRQIKRSDLKKKWLKYLGVIFLNVPAFTYAPVEGFSFHLLNFQFMLGISFSYMGYLNSAWTFGLPLGGIYSLWKVKQRSNYPAHSGAERVIEEEHERAEPTNL